jgi:hypothetical protein
VHTKKRERAALINSKMLKVTLGGHGLPGLGLCDPEGYRVCAGTARMFRCDGCADGLKVAL